MDKLQIQELGSSRPGIVTKKITGFGNGELYQLKNMPHGDAENKLIAMLNERNGNLGECWAFGYGIYGLWFDNEAAYVNIGSSCD